MADNEGEENQGRCCDVLWIVATKEGWIKLIEAIVTFLTFVILSSFPGSNIAEFEFLIFVATAVFIFVVLHIILRVTHVFEKLPAVLRHPILGMGGCFVAALGLLIGSAIVFAKWKDYGSYFEELEISGICGFISTGLFFCEGVYFFFLFRRLSRLHRSEENMAEKGEADVFVPPLKPANWADFESRMLQTGVSVFPVWLRIHSLKWRPLVVDFYRAAVSTQSLELN